MSERPAIFMAVLTLLFLLVPPKLLAKAYDSGAEGRTVVFLIVPGGAQYVFGADEQQRNVGEDDEDVAEVRDGPEIAEVYAGEGAGDAECGDEDAEQADAVDEALSAADAVGGNL